MSDNTFLNKPGNFQKSDIFVLFRIIFQHSCTRTKSYCPTCKVGLVVTKYLFPFQMVENLTFPGQGNSYFFNHLKSKLSYKNSFCMVKWVASARWSSFHQEDAPHFISKRFQFMTQMTYLKYIFSAIVFISDVLIRAYLDNVILSTILIGTIS